MDDTCRCSGFKFDRAAARTLSNNHNPNLNFNPGPGMIQVQVQAWAMGLVWVCTAEQSIEQSRS